MNRADDNIRIAHGQRKWERDGESLQRVKFPICHMKDVMMQTAIYIWDIGGGRSNTISLTKLMRLMPDLEKTSPLLFSEVRHLHNADRYVILSCKNVYLLKPQVRGKT